MRLAFNSYNNQNQQLTFSVDMHSDSEEEEKSPDRWQSELRTFLATLGSELLFDNTTMRYTVTACQSVNSFLSDQIKNIFVESNRMTPEEWTALEQSAALIPIELSQVNILKNIPKALALSIIRKGLFSYRDQLALQQVYGKYLPPNYKNLLKIHFPEDFALLESLKNPPTEKDPERIQFNMPEKIVTNEDYQHTFNAARKRDYQSFQNKFDHRKEETMILFKEGSLIEIKKLVEDNSSDLSMLNDSRGRSIIEWTRINKHKDVLDYLYTHDTKYDPNILECAIRLLQPIEIISKLTDTLFPKSKNHDLDKIVYSSHEEEKIETKENYEHTSQNEANESLSEADDSDDEDYQFHQQSCLKSLINKAAGYGHLEALKLLLSIDVLLKPENLKTAWCKAVRWGRLNTAEYISLNYDIDLADVYEDQDLGKFMRIHSIQLLEYLCRLGTEKQINIATLIQNAMEAVTSIILNQDNIFLETDKFKKICDLAIKYNLPLPSIINLEEISPLTVAFAIGDVNTAKYIMMLYEMQKINVDALSFLMTAMSGLMLSNAHNYQIIQYICNFCDSKNFDFTQPIKIKDLENQIPLMTLFCTAAISGNKEGVEYLYEKYKMNVEFAPILIEAIASAMTTDKLKKRNCLDIIRYLCELCLKEKINLNSLYKDTQSTTAEVLFNTAVERNLNEIISYLYTLIVLPERRAVALTTAMVTTTNLTIANILLDLGANPKATLSNGATLLIHHVQKGHQDIVEKLIDLGADVNATYSASVPEILEANPYHKKVVEKLIKAHCNDNLPETLMGFSALHIAVFFGHHEIAEMLCGRNANLTKKDHGISVIEVAMALGANYLITKIFIPSLLESSELDSIISDLIINSIIYSSSPNSAIKNLIVYLMKMKIDFNNALEEVCLRSIDQPHEKTLYVEINRPHQVPTHCDYKNNIIKYATGIEMIHHPCYIKTLLIAATNGQLEKFDHLLCFLSERGLEQRVTFIKRYLFDIIKKDINIGLDLYAQPIIVEHYLLNQNILKMEDELIKRIKDQVIECASDVRNKNNHPLVSLANYLKLNKEKKSWELWRKSLEFHDFLIAHILFAQAQFHQPKVLAKLINQLFDSHTLAPLIRKNNEFRLALLQAKEKSEAAVMSMTEPHTPVSQNVDEEEEKKEESVIRAAPSRRNSN